MLVRPSFHEDVTILKSWAEVNICESVCVCKRKKKAGVGMNLSSWFIIYGIYSSLWLEIVDFVCASWRVGPKKEKKRKKKKRKAIIFKLDVHW